ncbi:hypothetical protein CH330_02065 [candidate division WOR-3 bacterium JGI_Cruoil_03_51_56]|uniref:Uncharacterized protein n=1 Tax=candidate division WOR-3 bacterium JGI_Cruoil_03_51_56 TaxID=1973747 RepID=A0A235BX33_UNCW3|nr:MAG: hypothetical protein CH330_02065 [candidate division WOR-3 bacterium JGI_Cruoil_03_51_56]
MSRNWKGENSAGVKLVPPWSWVSYVGSVTSVLKSRGLDCDFTDVAGMSGYAFVVNIHDKLCPSGPTAFDWTMLEEGTQALGMETEILMVAHEGGTNEEELISELFERVRHEIDKGRCCVVWGATSTPEFSIVHGYRDNSYLVRSRRSQQGKTEREWKRPLGEDEFPEEPVRYDRLQAPGWLGAVFFGDRIEKGQSRAERKAVARAVQLLRDQHACFDPDYAHGTNAFEVWAELIEAGKAEVFGNAYNVHCYWEMQMLASGFCRRLAKRYPKAALALDNAAEWFWRSSLNLERLKKMFPLPKGDTSDRISAKPAARLLRECKGLNEQAVRFLQKALALF